MDSDEYGKWIKLEFIADVVTFLGASKTKLDATHYWKLPGDKEQT